jgi:hypothetical protein
MANTKILIDFSGQRIFESATVDVNIILIGKYQGEQSTLSCIIKENCKNNMTDYIRHSGVHITFPKDGKSWVILSKMEQSIKEKIERIGTPLKNWGINIYRGILTGCNEAFIIDKTKRDELIEKNSKSAEIIRPILRGRDIKRYGYEFADQYIIATFPSKKYNIDDYPAVRDYLLQYGKKRLKQSGKPGARKRTTHKWFETQDPIGYWDDFSKQVIAWQRITSKNQFCLTDEDMVVLDSMAFLSNIEKYKYWLLAFLNSNLIFYWIKWNVHEYGDNGFRLSNQYVEKIPIPEFDKRIENRLRILINEESYKEIDEIIYSIYRLDNEEIRHIKSNISNLSG